MNRLEFYGAALRNLGLASTFNLQLQRFGSSPLRLTAKGLHHPVTARRGSSDIDVFQQIFTFREYRCLDNIELSGTIIDIGANVGFSAVYFLSRFKNCNVIAVEPDPQNYAILVENVAPYGDRCRTINAAVWPYRERLKLDPSSTSIGQEWGRRVARAAANDVSIEAITMHELITLSGQERVTLLKIDIEGAETELFRSCDWLEKIENIVIELHGKEAETVFNSAISHRDYSVSRCDELTVCLNVS